MKHLDLFSGIGGASLAADRVWPNLEHTFCEIDEYCQKILKKHWPTAEIYGDIRTLTNANFRESRPRNESQPIEPTHIQSGTDDRDGTLAHANGIGHLHGQSEIEPAKRGYQTQCEPVASIESPFLLTGGFPCQPFSQAGRRKGTDDNRYLWPEMLRVIREFRPRWVVAENVAGLLTIQQGMVFGQVLSDLESENYEVQPFVIPACALNAPHRRDRVWIVAHLNEGGLEEAGSELASAGSGRSSASNSDSISKGLERKSKDEAEGQHRQFDRTGRHERFGWERNWLEVATELCGVDDGLPAGLHFLRGMNYNRGYEQNQEGKDKEAVPTLEKSVWNEMRKVWEYWATSSPSSKNDSEGFYSFVCSLPHERTSKTRHWDVGAKEKEKELCGLWQSFYSSSFNEAQNLFPRVLEHIGEMERTKKVGTDGLKLSKAGHRNARLKALGNAWVPQVAEEIFKAIKEVETKND